MRGEDLRLVLSQNIKQFRSFRKLSQADLAEKAKISIPYLSAIECANKWPSPDTIVSIAKALDTEVFELFKTEHTVVQDVRETIDKMTSDIIILVNETMENIKKHCPPASAL